MTSRTSRDYIAQAERWGAHNYHPLDVVLTRGQGPFVWDVEGRRYVDMLSAYSAVGQGHCHPKIVGALVEQASKLTLSSRAFHNDKMGDMLERIGKLTTFSNVLPMNTGAEAVETAVKAMRRYGYQHKKIPDDTAEIIVATGNFHGRTTTIISFSDEPAYKKHFGPPTPGFKWVPFGDAAAFAKAVTPNTVGVLIEPIQGEGGVNIPPDGYLTELRNICTSNGVLLAFDEVQTGLGRTGKMFAWQHENARPDLMVLGKALSGGLYPVSCLCADRDVMAVFNPGSHGSTYGGNPLAAAVCLAALDVLEEEALVEKSATLGEFALGRLRAEVRGPGVKEVRGRGLMMAVEYERPVAHDVVVALANVGILAKDTRDTVIRFMPPLVIEKNTLSDAIDTIVPVLNQWAAPLKDPMRHATT